MLNPIFSKKVQGQKHPGRWGMVEHQISSIKVLFKTYTKGHKHPSIRLIYRWWLGSGNGFSAIRQQAITWANVDPDLCHQMAALGHNELTLNVWGSSYLGLARSISWLLMPWLLLLPRPQQPWYCLHRIGRSLSYSRKDFNYRCHINVEEWHKM